MTRRSWLLPSVVALTLAGCATTYQWNNQKFPSAAAALSAQSSFTESALSRIQPTDHRVGGKLRVYYPNRDIGRELLVTGAKASANGDFVLDTIYADVRFLRSVIEKRGIFDEVELEFGSNEHREADPDSTVLYFFILNSNAAQWYYRGRTVPRSPMNFDGAESDPVKRTAPFLDVLEGFARADAASQIAEAGRAPTHQHSGNSTK